MNQYQPFVPRVALGFAAVAMTAITIAVSVVLPANMDSTREAPVLAVSAVPVEASMVPAALTRIDVVASRTPESATVACDHAKTQKVEG